MHNTHTHQHRTQSTHYNVIIIGAGASGMMCAATAGYRGKRTLVIDHAPKAGAKIRISGGGKCNFTNRQVSHLNYHGQNPHFVKSALARYSSQDFIDLVERHGIDYEERDYGQLFTLNGASDIVQLLRTECDWAGVSFVLNTSVNKIDYQQRYVLDTTQGQISCDSLVIATGALSYPKLKASDFGYKVANQFNIPVVKTRASLVGLRVQQDNWCELAGIALPVKITCGEISWHRDMLITHTGISGPAVLQISNTWHHGDTLYINWLIEVVDAQQQLLQLKANNKNLHTWLRQQLPKRLADYLWQQHPLDGKLAEIDNERILTWLAQLEHWPITPTGTEGYSRAEVTLGGVDTRYLSSKDMQVKHQPGLYFIGEVLDVTGDLGGFNFQWAWASGTACGLAV